MKLSGIVGFIVAQIYKDFLFTLEEIYELSDSALEDLYESVCDDDKKKVDRAEIFTDTYRDILRKRVLDKGNDGIRKIDALLNDLEVELKWPEGKR